MSWKCWYMNRNSTKYEGDAENKKTLLASVLNEHYLQNLLSFSSSSRTCLWHYELWLNMSLMADGGSLGSKWPIHRLAGQDGFICLTLTPQLLLQPLKRQFSLQTQGSGGKHTLINSIYYSCLQPCNPLTSRTGYNSCPATLFTDRRIGFVQRQHPHVISYTAAATSCSYRCTRLINTSVFHLCWTFRSCTRTWQQLHFYKASDDQS